MIKKITILIVLMFFMYSCSSDNKEEELVIVKENNCKSSFVIGEINKTNLKLKGVVVSDDIKTISSPMAGNITYLNCEAGKEVYSNTLVAKISPDFNNPSIINLSVQKGSLLNQKNNIISLKSSTIANIDSQIYDIKEQIQLVYKNIELTKKSGNFNKNDLKKQIESLENTFLSLNENLELLKKSKKEALDKINISKNSLFSNIKSIGADNLLKVDETFGFTTENMDLNDSYENYLGTKNTSLLSEVKDLFLKTNKSFESIEQMSISEVSNFLENLVLLNEKSRLSVKESIPNTYFPQTQIDNLYTLFLNYGNNLSELKNSWDSLENSINQTETNYNTQISSLENQLKTTQTSLENLKTNKVLGADTSLDLQISQLDSQLKTLKTNLDSLESSKKSQIINFDNQILQLNQSIDSLDINLQSRNIYSGIDGIIKQKLSSKGNSVGPNSPVCQIIPNSKSTKIKIYSPVKLDIGDKLVFSFDGSLYDIIIENVLIYKDPATQNFVYESNYLDRKFFKDGEIIELNYESENFEKINNNKSIIKVPVSYIKNKINGNFIKTNSGGTIFEKKVQIGDINGNYIEVIKGLEGVVEVCK